MGRLPSRGGISAVPSGGEHCRRRREQAFTILEVMLAIFVFALVLTAIYTTWLGILKGTKIGLEAAASVQRSRIALHAIEHALLTARMYNANQPYYAFMGEKDYLSLVARLPAWFPGVGRYGDQVVRRITFELKSGRNGMNELVMSQEPLLMGFENSGSQPYTIVLARDISAFDLVYWDMKQQDWVEEWTDANTNQLPQLVQVTLGMGKVGGSGRPQDLVTRIVSVPSLAVTPDLQGFGPRQNPALRNPNLRPIPTQIPTIQQ